MLTLPTNFEASITGGEVNKIIYIKMYYGDETDYVSFASRSIDCDDKLAFGAVVNYNPSKST